jgi:hypothetical protein
MSKRSFCPAASRRKELVLRLSDGTMVPEPRIVTVIDSLIVSLPGHSRVSTIVA